MKLTENTKVRVKVPKHLYEAIQAELDKKHGMDEGHYGDKEMEEGEDHLEEIDPKFQGAMDVLSSIPGVDKIAQIDPFLAGVTLVGMLAGGLIAAPKIESGIKALIAKIKDPKKKAQLAAAAGKEGVKVGGEAKPVSEASREGVYDDFAKWKASFPEGTEFAQENNYMMAKDEDGKELGKWNPIQKQGMHADDFQYDKLEEAFDLITLMEAVKDLSKKKAEDKKKKELEAKKKKAEDDKKKRS